MKGTCSQTHSPILRLSESPARLVFWPFVNKRAPQRRDSGRYLLASEFVDRRSGELEIIWGRPLSVGCCAHALDKQSLKRICSQTVIRD